MKTLGLFFLVTFLPMNFLWANEGTSQYDSIEITRQKITENIFMLMGSGGNMGLSIGEDGVFLIDDQFAPLTDKIKSVISEISNKEVRFLLNTHWHFDHTGGNERWGEMGTVIVAHENVRKRLSKDQFIEFFQKKVPATKKAGLPIITFTKDISFYLNGDKLHVFHLAHAHTDGDALVLFEKSNIIHMGDIYFSDMYPFIDVPSGGSVKGLISAIDFVLFKINDQTKIIPGHGPLSNKDELSSYRNMLKSLEEKITKLIKQDKTLEEIKAMKPTAPFDENYGKGFIPGDKFTELLFSDLAK